MLTPLILNLLYRNDCVIVPGLGAFITRRLPSTFDEQSQVMLPPRKEVAFNPDLRHTDGLLADFLTSQGQAPDYASAQQQIDNFVSEVLHKTADGAPYLMPDLGSLALLEGRLSFTPAPGLNTLVESYGLQPVAAQRVKTRTLDTIATADLRKAVATAAAVAALLLVSPQTSDTTLTRADMTQPFLASLTASRAPQPRQQPPAETPEMPETDQELLEPATTVDSYCVVVASFLTRQEAQDYIASMRARGVTDLSALDYDGRVRVIAAQFPDHDQAVRANREIRNLQGFEKAWVLRVAQ